MARPGDWVAAFKGQARHLQADARGALVWAGRIERKIAWEDYAKEFRNRTDVFYRTDPPNSSDWCSVAERYGLPNYLMWKRVVGSYHDDKDQVERDLSAGVLIFDMQAAWYFGDTCWQVSQQIIGLVPKNRGHRVWGEPPEVEDQFRRDLFAKFSPGILGKHDQEDMTNWKCVRRWSKKNKNSALISGEYQC